jgi:hypothetical protein
MPGEDPTEGEDGSAVPLYGERDGQWGFISWGAERVNIV